MRFVYMLGAGCDTPASLYNSLCDRTFLQGCGNGPAPFRGPETAPTNLESGVRTPTASTLAAQLYNEPHAHLSALTPGTAGCTASVRGWCGTAHTRRVTRTARRPDTGPLQPGPVAFDRFLIVVLTDASTPQRWPCCTRRSSTSSPQTAWSCRLEHPDWLILGSYQLNEKTGDRSGGGADLFASGAPLMPTPTHQHQHQRRQQRPPSRSPRPRAACPASSTRAGSS